MLASFTQGNEIVVVGAGPYGLSLAAHLREQELPFRIFGKAMQTWSTQMPEGMFLRSGLKDSCLSAAGASFSLGDYIAAGGRNPSSARIALADFVAYGEAFARQFVPDLEPDYIRSINRQRDLFRITTVNGERLLSRRVVIATGLNYLQHTPRELRHLPATRVTHPSQHSNYSEFRGRDVTVLGSGASALNAAALLKEAGARVTLIARATKLKVDAPPEAANAASKNPVARLNPDLYRRLPEPMRAFLNARQNRPCGDGALHGRLEGFPILLGCRIHAVEPADGACERLRVTLTDGRGQVRQHLTTHLISATGYQYDKGRVQMLSQSLREQIRVGREGAPKLNHGFESTVPGLHFIGPLAAPSFGPQLRSIAGSGFAAQRVAHTLRSSLEREDQRAESRGGVGVLARRQRTL